MIDMKSIDAVETRNHSSHTHMRGLELSVGDLGNPNKFGSIRFQPKPMMPSLRKSTKSTKSSRTTSPSACPTESPLASPALEPRKLGKQTLLDTWVEPRPRTPVPSFEDHNFIRGGVVASMAPLGALPPASLKLKLKLPKSYAVESRNESPTLLSPPELASQTPGGTPPSPDVPTQPGLQYPALDIAVVKAYLQEQHGMESVSRFTTNGSNFSALPLQPVSPSLQNGGSSSTHTPTAIPSRQPSASRTTPQSASKSSFSRTPSRPQRMDIIVKACVQLSETRGKPVLGRAVERLYNESLYDQLLADTLDSILRQNATPQHLAEFSRRLKGVKKQLKAEEASAKRLRPKSLSNSGEGALTFASIMLSNPSSTTMGKPYSESSTIETSRSQTPPQPPPPPLSFYPFPASSKTFHPARSSRKSSDRQSLRSSPTSLPFTHSVNGACTTTDEMVLTRAQTRKGNTADASPTLPTAQDQLPVAATVAVASLTPTNVMPDSVTSLNEIVTSAADQPAGSDGLGANANVSTSIDLPSLADPPVEALIVNSSVPLDLLTHISNGQATDDFQPDELVPNVEAINPADQAIDLNNNHAVTESDSPCDAPADGHDLAVEDLRSNNAVEPSITLPVVPPVVIATHPAPAGAVPASNVPKRNNRRIKKALTRASSPVASIEGASGPAKASAQEPARRQTRRATAAAAVLPVPNPESIATAASRNYKRKRTAPIVSRITSQAVSPDLAVDMPAATSPARAGTLAAAAAKSQRSRTVSMSPLSEVDEVLIHEGPPSQPESPPRQTLKLTNKGAKGKKIALKSKKRPAADEVNEETAKRRKTKVAEYESALGKRKASWPVTTAAVGFRLSAEYENSLPAGGPRLAAVASAIDPQTSLAVPAIASSSRVASPVPPVAPSRRTRESTQKQKVDLTIATQLRLSPGPHPAPSTPRSDRGEPVAKKRKTNKRTIISPEKAAARRANAPNQAAGGDDSPEVVTDEDNSHMKFCFGCEKDDGNDLLLCDGCDKAFHLQCWDPPLDKNALEIRKGVDWYCFECSTKRNENTEAPLDAVPGAFAPLFSGLQRDDPTKFQLPHETVKDFEFVYSGPNGEYRDENDCTVPSLQRNPSTAESFDEGKLLAFNNIAPPLCVACGLSVMSKPYLLRCDVPTCKQSWHMDCLDDRIQHDRPPITIGTETVNNREVAVNKRQFFKCPRHLEQNMHAFDHPIFADDNTITSRGVKIRSMKEPNIVKPAIERGFRNDGQIEIELSDSEEEDVDDSEVNMDSTVWKLSERSIKLNFIEKAKRDRILKAQTTEDLFKLLHPEAAAGMRKAMNAVVERQIQDGIEARIKAGSATKLINMVDPSHEAATGLTMLAKHKQNYSITAVNRKNISLLLQASIATLPDAREQYMENAADAMGMVELEKLERLVANAKSKLKAKLEDQNAKKRARATEGDHDEVHDSSRHAEKRQRTN